MRLIVRMKMNKSEDRNELFGRRVWDQILQLVGPRRDRTR
jgi:hypothetical protein